MSGGSFDYAFMKAQDFVRELHCRLTSEQEDSQQFYDERILPILQESLIIIQQASDIMHAIEWLYSDDYGEETFIAEMEEIRLKYK